MKKLVFYIIVIFALSSCTISGPWTGTEYSIGANRNEGIYIKAMPLRWKETVDTAKAIGDWAAGDEPEE